MMIWHKQLIKGHNDMPCYYKDHMIIEPNIKKGSTESILLNYNQKAKMSEKVKVKKVNEKLKSKVHTPPAIQWVSAKDAVHYIGHKLAAGDHCYIGGDEAASYECGRGLGYVHGGGGGGQT